MVSLYRKLGLVLVLLFVSTRSMFGFALLGPFNEAFEVSTIGYNLSPPSNDRTDIGAPKNLAEEYRRNTPTVYYAYDTSFVDYFGSNGIAAIDQAFAVFNSLSNVDSYSGDLSEWPTSSSRINFRAQALSLLDLKSETMYLLAEQLGLAQPDRYTYCLHDRFLPGGAQCPNYEYLVIQRNYDPVNQNYSAYVNGTLYGYVIEDLCALSPNPFAPLEADAVEYSVDPSTQFTAVAAGVLGLGQFYTGLTYDDVGGLRYLISTNNINKEAAESTSQLIFTNQSNAQLLVTSNLAVFLQQAQTNDAATLEALYPGLIITASSNFFSNVVTTNIEATVYRPPNAPAGTFQIQFLTNYTTNVATLFVHTFANVVTNHFYSNGYVTTVTTNLVAPPNAPVGYVVASTNVSTVFTSFANGDFYLIPSNALCSSSGYQILSTQLVQVIPVTNTFGTNTTSTTGTITNGQSTIFSVVTYFTNYSLVVYPIQCIDGTNSADLREGIEKVNFVRRDFDSLIGGTWVPVTNFYTMTAVTNGNATVQSFRRVVTQPDILIVAADLASGPAGRIFNLADTRNITFNASNAVPGLAGPGTIAAGGVAFTYNKVGPVFYNAGPYFQNPPPIWITPDVNSALTFVWGSFDGTTNDPIVYPSTLSISNLESQIFFQITTPLLPDASVSTNRAGNPYNAQLQATGASPPYTWSLGSNSPALPPGLSLSSGGVISGSPTTVGTYDFTVQATDIGLRVTAKPFFIQVDP